MEISNQTTSIVALLYETEYVLDDPLFVEPLVILKTKNLGRPAWWNGAEGMTKVVKLLDAFKRDSTVWNALINGDITERQYKYFNRVHSSFAGTKAHVKKMAKMLRQELLIAHGFRANSKVVFPHFKLPKIQVCYWDRNKNPHIRREFKAQMRIGGFMARYKQKTGVTLD